METSEKESKKMIILAVVGLVAALFLTFAYGIFIAYHSIRLSETPEWLEKTYEFMFGWI